MPFLGSVVVRPIGRRNPPLAPRHHRPNTGHTVFNNNTMLQCRPFSIWISQGLKLHKSCEIFGLFLFNSEPFTPNHLLIRCGCQFFDTSVFGSELKTRRCLILEILTRVRRPFPECVNPHRTRHPPLQTWHPRVSRTFSRSSCPMPTSTSAVGPRIIRKLWSKTFFHFNAF